MRAEVVGLVLLGGLVQACDSPMACGDKVTVSRSVEAPVIASADVASQLAQDTWTVVLGVDFTDADGDLGDGKVEFHLNDKSNAASSQPLLAVFHESAVDVGATAGSLTVPLRFDDTIRNGTDVHLGLQLIDQAGHRSNCYGLALAFEVTPP